MSCRLACHLILVFTLFGIASSASAADPAQACMDCHGKDGVSTESDVPIIAGASEAYLTDSMADYREKSRPCPESKYRAGDKKRPATDMCRIATGLSQADAAKAVAYFASKPFVPAKQHVDAQKAAAGKKLHALHCEKCHADGGRSAEDDAGVLAGQWMPYLQSSMKEFMGGKREMPEKMKVEKLSAGDIEALIQYYGSQN